MGWRRILPTDLATGVLVMIESIFKDGGYAVATIISVNLDPTESYQHIKIARPFAFANKDRNTRSPLLGSEVVDISIGSLFRDDSDYFVFEDSKGRLHQHVT